MSPLAPFVVLLFVSPEGGDREDKARQATDFTPLREAAKRDAFGVDFDDFLEERRLVLTHLLEAVRASERDKRRWVLVESYQPQGTEHIVLFIAEGKRQDVEVLTNLPRQRPKDSPLPAVDTDVLFHYRFKKGEPTAGAFKSMRKPTRSGAWGVKVLDASSWLLCDSSGSKAYLYGYHAAYFEGTTEDLTVPAKDAPARSAYDRVVKALEMWESVSGTKPLERKRVVLRKKAKEGGSSSDKGK